MGLIEFYNNDIVQKLHIDELYVLSIFKNEKLNHLDKSQECALYCQYIGPRMLKCGSNVFKNK